MPSISRVTRPWSVATFGRYTDASGENTRYRFDKFNCSGGGGNGIDGQMLRGSQYQYIKGRVFLENGSVDAKIDGQHLTNIGITSNNSWANACFVKYGVKSPVMALNATADRIEFSHFGHGNCN